MLRAQLTCLATSAIVMRFPTWLHVSMYRFAVTTRAAGGGSRDDRIEHDGETLHEACHDRVHRRATGKRGGYTRVESDTTEVGGRLTDQHEPGVEGWGQSLRVWTRKPLGRGGGLVEDIVCSEFLGTANEATGFSDQISEFVHCRKVLWHVTDDKRSRGAVLAIWSPPLACSTTLEI